MAFGIEAGGVFLSIFRIIAVTFIILYIRNWLNLDSKRVSYLVWHYYLQAQENIDSIFYG